LGKNLLGLIGIIWLFFVILAIGTRVFLQISGNIEVTENHDIQTAYCIEHLKKGINCKDPVTTFLLNCSFHLTLISAGIAALILSFLEWVFKGVAGFTFMYGVLFFTLVPGLIALFRIYRRKTNA